MKVNADNSFTLMYQALEAAFRENTHSERLRIFASEANPFFWKDHSSLDPAIYNEFQQDWIKEFGRNEVEASDAWQFVCNYLKKQDEGEYAFAPAGDLTLKNAFESIADLEAWREALSNL